MTEGQQYQPPSPDPELYSHLGFMVRLAADLELRLQLVASSLCESPYAARWVHGQSSSRLIDLISGVAKLRPDITPERLASLQRLLKACTKLFERRHAYVHGAWSIDQSNPEVPSFQTMRLTRGQVEPRFDALSVDDLTDLSHQLSALTDDLMSWFLHPDTPGTHPEGPEVS